MIKSPLRYPGGKSRATDRIVKLFPSSFKEYREPFIGGGSIFIRAKQLYPNKKFWINDLYYELYTFWRGSQSNINEVLDLIYKYRKQYTTPDEMYKYLKENLDHFNDIEMAAAFFIFNRITFSGTTLSGGLSRSAFSKRFTESSIERLKSLSSIMNDIYITNTDYQEVVEAKGDDVFIFLDPPYHSAEKSALYGRNGNLHKGFDHIRFSQVMKNCNHKWLITYDDSEYIRSLFDFANIFSFDLAYGMRNVNKLKSDNIGKEIFISNYLTTIEDMNDTLLLF